MATDVAAIADLVRLAFATQSVVTGPPPSALEEAPESLTRES